MRLRDLIELITLAMIWGGSFVLMKIAAPEFGVTALVSIRLVLAALCLLPLLVYKQVIGQVLSNIKPILVVSVFNAVLPYCLLSFATLTFSGGYASIINATAPLWVALFGMIWLHSSITISALMGLVIGFLGVITMVLSNSGNTELAAQMLNTDDFYLALAAGLAATASYGGLTVYAKQKLSHVSSLVTAGGSLAGAAVMLLPVGLYYWPEQQPSTEAWLAVLVLALLCTSFAIVLYFRLIANIGPSKTIAVTYLIPVFGMGFGALWLNEVVTMAMLFGCGLILTGVTLATGLVGPKA
ncbi:MAG: drug/metabolite transporter (DMT)-like permease [Phenylobacterium sp.]|jgi:drug/metabolite transporter (DMT)-like permease